MDVMKKAVSFLLFTALAVSCLSGCGGEFTDGTGKAVGEVSGGAVSGGVVSGGAVSDEPVSEGAVSDEPVSKGAVSGGAVKKEEAGEDVQARGRFEPFCSENCGYYFRDDGPEALVQISLRNGKKKDYKVENMYELLYVGKDELIYCGESELGVDTFFTVPIVSRADGTEELKTAEAKQVPGVFDSLDYEGAMYADEQYIIYCREGKAEVKCYNRKTGKTSEMPMPGEIKGMVVNGIDCTKRIGERLYLDTMGDDTLCWQMDENKVYSYAGVDVEAWTKDGVIGIENNESSQNAVMIDVVSQKKTEIISNGEADRLLKQELGDVWYWAMEDLFLDGSRVYVQFDVERVKDKICYVQYVVLSREIGGSGELKYERKLTEKLMAADRKTGEVEEESPEEAHLAAKDTSGIEKVWHYDGYCVISGGKAYMVVGEGEKVSTYYNLKTGACKAVKKGDWEYHALNIIQGESLTRED